VIHAYDASELSNMHSARSLAAEKKKSAEGHILTGVAGLVGRTERAELLGAAKFSARSMEASVRWLAVMPKSRYPPQYRA